MLPVCIYCDLLSVEKHLDIIMFRVFIFRHEASLNRGVGARALTCTRSHWE